jgi:galactose mutarotase-like enzyme
MLSQFTIKNKYLKVAINRKGAELCSVKDTTGYEYMWQAEPVWPRHAPNLFPIVGSLLDHEYRYAGVTYTLSHHGFARDSDFEMLHQSEHSICLILQQSEATLASYPFEFTLLITYTLSDNSLKQTFRVINDDSKDVPVSFGGHPAFNAKPVDEYEIVYSESENVLSNQLSGPYINDKAIQVIEGNTISLTKNTFDNDALIFQGLKSKTVSLKHTKSNHEVKVDISEFPYLGIWAKPGSDYVCIEPWQGLADYASHSKNIEDKKGIIWVKPKEEVAKSFSMTFTK